MSECFHNVTVETTVHLLPSRLINVKEGVQALLSAMLMRYVYRNHFLSGISLPFTFHLSSSVQSILDSSSIL